MAIAAAALSPTARAEDAFSLSGFASLVAGKVISGERTEPLYAHPCPCFVADYGHGALYGPKASIKQESKIGVQGSYALTPKLSATAQVVGRGVDGVTAGLEWAYLSYEISPSWTVQLGRKRLPIYYYSDFQDVGYAYTWVRPPADIYGWEIVNYNGINATYRGQWGDWAVKSNLFTGGETSKDNLYQRIYYETPQEVRWKRIAGGDLVFSRDWLTARLTYIQSNVQQWDKSSGERVTPASDSERSAEKQRIYGISLNADIGNSFVRSEYSVFDRSSYSYKSNAWMLGAGTRLGAFTPMLTYSKYAETNSFAPDSVQRDSGLAMTLRYEMGPSRSLKLQYDRFKDRSGQDLSFVGRSRLISVALDTVF